MTTLAHRRNPLAARNPARSLGPLRGRFQGFPGYEPTYPLVPSWWPSRLVRRAVKQGHESRLSAAWKSFLAINPNVRKHIVTL
jgi:hypothetical protein